MKTKLVLLIAYITFIVLAAYEWRSADALIASQEQNIAAWQRLDARVKAGVVDLKEPVKYLQAYQGVAQERIHQSVHEQRFIGWALVLTLPLALQLVVTLRKRSEPGLAQQV